MEFLIIFGIIAFLILMIVITSSKRKKQKKEAEKVASEKQASLYESFIHTAGLPIPEGTIATVYYCVDKIEIHASGTQFNLEKERLTDISIKTETEIQTHYTSSAGGAIGGALLFGAVGALIGGRAKQKKTKTIHSYLIISYTKDDSVDYIAFDVTSKILQAQKFKKEFQRTGEQKTITL